MTKKKTETEEKLTALVGDKPRPTSDNPIVDAFIENAVRKIEPGESATVTTRILLERPSMTTRVFTNTSEETVYVGESDEQITREADEEAAADWALLHGVKTQSDGGELHLKMPDDRLKYIAEDLIAMQHARAAAGNGTATHWQNAQSHIRRAIECIERQAVDDAEMASVRE